MSFIDQPPMSFQQRHVGGLESMGGGTKKQKPFCDGPCSHRSQATVPSPAGMTWLQVPV